MAEERFGSETEQFGAIVRDASKWCLDAYDAKRIDHRDEAIECLRRALEQIGWAFLHA